MKSKSILNVSLIITAMNEPHRQYFNPHNLKIDVICRCRQPDIRTICDLIRLSPLLIDEDDSHKNDDLSHYAKEGPQSSQTTADTQMNLVTVFANFVDSRAYVVPNVILDAQVIDGESGFVRGALDLKFVISPIDWLRKIKAS